MRRRQHAGALLIVAALGITASALAGCGGSEGSAASGLPAVEITSVADGATTVQADALRGPALVNLWATWCGPCRQVSPALEQLATERAGSLKLVKVDVDTAPGLSQQFQVQAVPTLLVVDKGRVLARKSGAAPVNALRSWLDQSLA